MSWLFGFIGKTNPQIIQNLKKIHSSSYTPLLNPFFYFSVGNSINTLVSNVDSNISPGWIVLGLGINDSGPNYKIMTSFDWEQYLETIENYEKIPNGHYVIVKWDTNRVSIYTDPTGLRDIYITKFEHGFVISTRLDWLGQFCKRKINFFEFGSRWLLFNQLSHQSILEETTRVVSGLKAEINSNSLSVSSFFESSIEKGEFNEEDFINRIKMFITTSYDSGLETSLSLSGGLDSRVILSLLLSSDVKNWTAHTFGEINHPDSIVAKEICNRLNIKHTQYDIKENDFNYTEDVLSDFVGYTLMGHPISAVNQLGLYENIEQNDVINIDGGFGEIWRREFLNKLLLKGKIALKTKNVHSIYNYLLHFKSDIFDDEVHELMKKGCIEQIYSVFNPKESYSSEEDLLDSIALRTRLVNYYGHEQTRLDNIIRSFMPFAQLELIKNLVRLSIHARKNGKLFKRIIKESIPILSEFRLVKGQLMLPYGLPTIAARIYTRILSKFGSAYQNNNSSYLLMNLQTKVFDTLNSQSYRECKYYNQKKINNIVQNFYQGDSSYSSQLDWWLTFEIFRQNIENH